MAAVTPSCALDLEDLEEVLPVRTPDSPISTLSLRDTSIPLLEDSGTGAGGNSQGVAVDEAARQAGPPAGPSSRRVVFGDSVSSIASTDDAARLTSTSVDDLANSSFSTARRTNRRRWRNMAQAKPGDHAAVSRGGSGGPRELLMRTASFNDARTTREKESKGDAHDPIKSLNVKASRPRPLRTLRKAASSSVLEKMSSMHSNASTLSNEDRKESWRWGQKIWGRRRSTQTQGGRGLRKRLMSSNKVVPLQRELTEGVIVVDVERDNWSSEIFWAGLRTLCAAYLLITIPLRLGFFPDYTFERSYAAFIAFDTVAETFLLVCTFYAHRKLLRTCLRRVVRVITRVLRRKRSLEFTISEPRSQPREIAIFALETVALLHIEVFAFAAGERSLIFFKLNRMLWCFRMMDFTDEIFALLEDKRVVRHLGVQRMVKFYFTLAMFGHWAACLFYRVGLDSSRTSQGSWLAADGLLGAANDLAYPLIETYGRAVYWAFITMCTTGFGDIVPVSLPEVKVTMILMHVGVVICCAAIANLTIMINNFDAAQTAFYERLDRLDKYINYRKLPQWLKAKLVSFYEYRWFLLRGVNEQKFMNELPRTLQIQVSAVMRRDLLRQLPVLRGVNTAFLNALTNRLDQHLYSPGDVIMTKGEQIRGVIVVQRGEVTVSESDDPNSRIVQGMMSGDHYGDECLFHEDVRCDYSIRAKTYSEVLLLPAVAFQGVMLSQCSPSEIAQIYKNSFKNDKRSPGRMKMARVRSRFESRIATERSESVRSLADSSKRHFLPQSTFRQYWDLLIFCCAVFYALTMPMHLAAMFAPVNQMRLTLLCFTWIVDATWAAHVYLEFKYFMFLEDGIVTYAPEKIKERFLTRRSAVKELVEIFPWELFLAIDARPAFFAVVRFPKILRLGRLVPLTGLVQKRLREYFGWYTIELGRFLEYNLAMLLLCHWAACFFIFASELSRRGGFFDRDLDSWVEADRSAAERCSPCSSSFGQHDDAAYVVYLRALYFSMVGMSTVGYGDIVPPSSNPIETGAATAIVFVGAIVLPAMVGGLASLMERLTKNARQYRQRMRVLRRAMAREEFSPALMEKVLNYADYKWSRQGVVNEAAVLKELPPPLRRNVANVVTGAALRSIPFLRNCEEGVRQALASRLVPRVFLPGDVVIRAGEIGKELYLVERGFLVVSSEDQRVAYATLHDGDYFGESILLRPGAVRTATVTAKSYCDCFLVTLSSVLEVMTMFPNWSEEIHRSLSETLSTKLRHNERVRANFHRMNERKPWSTYLEPVLAPVQTSAGQPLQNGQHTVFLPDGRVQQCWTSCIFLCVIYQTFYVPYRIAFRYMMPFLVLDWIVDALFLVDLYVQSRHFAFLYEGELYCDQTAIWENFRQNGFYMAVFSCIPFELLALIAPRGTRLLAVAFLRVPKLLRLPRARKGWQNVERLLEHTTVTANAVQLVALLFCVWMVAHWAGCGLYMLARFRHFKDNCEDASETTLEASAAFEITEWAYCRFRGSWIQLQIELGHLPVDGGSDQVRYLRAIYWAAPTLLVVVLGDVVPSNVGETAYILFWLIIGMTISATVIGNVANFLANLNEEEASTTERAEALKAYMHTHKVPRNTQTRVNDFMMLMTAGQGTFGEQSYFDDLPYTLRMEISKNGRVQYIAKCPIFACLPPKLIEELAIRLVPEMYNNHDNIITAGEIGREMYFLVKGSVEVIAPDNVTLMSKLHEGVFFGETAVLASERRRATVRCVDFTEVYSLKDKAVQDVLADYPVYRGKIYAAVQELQHRYDVFESNLVNAADPAQKLGRIRMVVADESVLKREAIESKMLQPHSAFRCAWNVGIMCAAIFIVVTTPYFAAFYINDRENASIETVFTFNVLVDAALLADAILHYRFFPFVEKGFIVNDVASIRRHYMKQRRTMDVLGLFPVGVFALLASKGNLRVAYFCCRLFRFVRVVALPHYVRNIEKDLHFHQFRIPSSITLIAKVLTFFVGSTHWIACVWFMIHRYLERTSSDTWAINAGLATFDDERGVHDICTSTIHVKECYTRSFYFTLTTMSSVGYGDIIPRNTSETTFQLFVMTLAACVFAALIGAFKIFFQRIDSSGSSAFKLKMQSLEEYMRYRKFPRDLEQTILRHYKHVYERSYLLDDKEIMQDLPIPLRLDLAFAVRKRIIEAAPVLDERNEMTRKRIAMALTTQVSSQYTFIYEAGDVGWDVYFVGAGYVRVSLPSDLSVLDADGRRDAHLIQRKLKIMGNLLRKGNHFGEYALISNSGVRQETIEAASPVELYLLSKDSLKEICTTMTERDAKILFEDFLTKNGMIMHTPTTTVLQHVEAVWHPNHSDQRTSLSSGPELLRAHRTPVYQKSLGHQFFEKILGDEGLDDEGTRSSEEVDANGSRRSSILSNIRKSLNIPGHLLAQAFHGRRASGRRASMQSSKSIESDRSRQLV